MNACAVDPLHTLYLHLTWFSGGFRSLSWMFGEAPEALLSGSSPLDHSRMKEIIEAQGDVEHIILHVEGDEGGPAAAKALYKDGILLSELLDDECDFDVLAAMAESSQHLIEPPGVRSGKPIPARDLWIIPAGQKHPQLTSMRPMQANSRRKAAHLEDVNRMADLHVEKRKMLGCGPQQKASGRPMARRGGRRTGRLSPER